MKKLTLFLLLSSLIALPAQADSFRVEQLASGYGVPWGLQMLDAQRLLVSERSGKLSLLNLQTGQRQSISGLPEIHLQGQGGLLDIAIAPDETAGWIYFTYSKPVQGQGATTLARARLKDLRLHDWQDLLVTRSTTDTGYHFGSRIAFDDRGYVFFGIGDRGVRPNSQNLENHAGSIIRLHRDGRVPADNPFVNRPDALPETWSYGHRNPQGLAWDNLHKRLWEIEHGPRGGDEINLIEKGQNYGWPVISYGKEYWGPVAVGEGTHKAGMQQPVKVYIPSIAPGSLLYYQGDAFPQWRGNLFAGALKLRHLNQITLDADGNAIAEDRLLEDLGERIRALTTDEKGRILFSTDSGKIYRLSPQ